MEIVFLKTLSTITLIVVIMVILEGKLNLTEPGEPHWFKTIGGFLCSVAMFGWSGYSIVIYWRWIM